MSTKQLTSENKEEETSDSKILERETEEEAIGENPGNEDTPEAIRIPVIIIKSNEENIRIAAKKGGDVSIQDINPKLILATLWWEGEPQLEKFFQILELTIKRALQEVHPHQKLILDYTYYSNDTLEDASEISVEINQIKIDETNVGIEGDLITLSGTDSRGFFKKLTAFRRKIEENVHKEL